MRHVSTFFDIQLSNSRDVGRERIEFFHIFLAYLIKKLYNNRRAKLIVQKKR